MSNYRGLGSENKKARRFAWLLSYGTQSLGTGCLKMVVVPIF
jgi:hypothetical protein